MEITKKKNRIKGWLIITSLLIAFFISGHMLIMKKIDQYRNITVEFANQKIENETRQRIENIKQQVRTSNDFIPIEKSAIIPFKEVSVLDKDAKDWSNVFDGYAACGVLVFDANGDDLMDLYLTHNGQNWTRPTDDNAVLHDKPYRQHNGLYLNQGNDEQGNPVYKQVKDLMQNTTFMEEELLVENFLFPRKSPNEPYDDKIARASSSAISVDINADGRPDLLVSNTLQGMFWSSEKTQRVLGQYVRPVGRRAINSKVPLSAQGLHFISDYVPDDGINDVRPSSRGEEPLGANSIFLNMGDKDGDGLPEWKDISKESGLQGKRTTTALLAEDFDRDGDIDIFESNIMDPDYWPGGATELAGGANQLYLNQLKETGTLSFTEVSSKFNCDGLYNEDYPVPNYYRLKRYPFLPKDYHIALSIFETYQPDYLEINGEKSEPGQISWAATTTDANGDGYPDIWVANDLGYLRLYLNQKGKGFKLADKHVRHNKTGYWMSLSAADFNGDMVEDVFAGNMGGTAMNLAHPIPDPYMLFNPTMTSSTTAQLFFSDKHSPTHAFIDGKDFTKEMSNKVKHSDILPPDASIPNNIRSFGMNLEKVDYDPSSIDPYEFTWGSTILDVQNDGKNDLYWLGCLYGRGGNIFPITGTGPGRLLVNQTNDSTKDLKFADLTAEYNLFNIQELQYDQLQEKGYIYRKAPRQNWRKKSTVYSHDVSVWGFQGPDLAEQITNQDMIQAAENGRAVIAADLNDDGFQDIVMRNLGGYDSRASNTKNLKAKVNGDVVVIPSHDPNYPTPTNYEPGSTRMFINQHNKNNWIKIQLVDDSIGNLNIDAIGAKVYVNEAQLKVKRVGGGGFISNYVGPLHFGLGEQTVKTVRVVWPDANQTETTYQFDNAYNTTITLSKLNGIKKDI